LAENQIFYVPDMGMGEGGGRGGAGEGGWNGGAGVRWNLYRTGTVEISNVPVRGGGDEYS
jgi:hypothetical protein